MIRYMELSYYAHKLYNEAPPSSPQERVGDYILYLMGFGHCVESILEKLQKRAQLQHLYGEDTSAYVEAIKRIKGEK